MIEDVFDLLEQEIRQINPESRTRSSEGRIGIIDESRQPGNPRYERIRRMADRAIPQEGLRYIPYEDGQPTVFSTVRDSRGIPKPYLQVIDFEDGGRLKLISPRDPLYQEAEAQMNGKKPVRQLRQTSGQTSPEPRIRSSEGRVGVIDGSRQSGDPNYERVRRVADRTIPREGLRYIPYEDGQPVLSSSVRDSGGIPKPYLQVIDYKEGRLKFISPRDPKYQEIETQRQAFLRRKETRETERRTTQQNSGNQEKPKKKGVLGAFLGGLKNSKWIRKLVAAGGILHGILASGSC